MNLLQWQQNRFKATMLQLYEFHLFGGAKKFLVDSRLCVACYYPTTPTDYPSTTGGTSVGHPVAVNINICGHLWFFSINLSELYGYSTSLTNFLVKREFLLHKPVLIFQPTVNSRASDNCSKQFQNCISQLGKMRSYKVSTYISVFVQTEEVEGVHSGYWMKAWPSRVLQPSKPQQLTKKEWTKFLQTSTHCLRCICKLFGYLKGSLHDVYIRRSALNG